MTDSDSVGRWFESSRAYQKERHAKSVSFFLGFADFWPAPPFGISMLGGSTRKGYATSVRRQSRQRLCGEFRLRRGFACGKTLARRARLPLPAYARSGSKECCRPELLTENFHSDRRLAQMTMPFIAVRPVPSLGLV